MQPKCDLPSGRDRTTCQDASTTVFGSRLDSDQHWLLGRASYGLDGATDLYVKVGNLTNNRDTGYDLGAEAERLRWLAKVGISTPEVVAYDISEDCAWLVTRQYQVGRPPNTGQRTRALT